jgi:predicted N-acetyltransferase YhbS
VPTVVIREEMETDAPAIRRLNEEAFGQPAEGRVIRYREEFDGAI